MFGEWMQRSDCTCVEPSFEPTKHACCMRMTENIFEAALRHWDDPMSFFAVTQYNAKLAKNQYMRSKEASFGGKMKDWMKQYKDMKYTKSPFNVLKTLLIEFGKEGKEDMIKAYGVDQTLNFVFAEGEDKKEMDTYMAENMGLDMGIMQGWRELIMKIIRTALFEAEKKEEALVEIFRAIRDMETIKERMAILEMNGDEMQMWDVMELMTRASNYEEELKPIDVVRCTLQMFMIWTKDEVKAAPVDQTEQTDEIAADVTNRRRRQTDEVEEAASAEEEDVSDMEQWFIDNNMEKPETEEMKQFWELLDIIDMAYENPLEAKF